MNYGFIFPHELRIRVHRIGSISNVVKYKIHTLKRSDAFSPECSVVAFLVLCEKVDRLVLSSYLAA